MTRDAFNCTVLFADVVGSSQLYDQLGDARAFERISRVLSVMTEIVSQYAGTVVKTIGDEVMARFDSPDQALAAASAMQEYMSTRTRFEQGTRLSTRIGLHHGSVLREGDDVYGDAVNIAARMCATANPGQILTTESTVAELSSKSAVQMREYDYSMIKGKRDPIVLYEVLWQMRELTTIPPVAPTNELLARCLVLRYRKHQETLLANSGTFRIGRDERCDMPFALSIASREHAEIVYQRGKFVLRDHSTNGTYLQVDGTEAVFLRREQAPLVGQGHISIGQPISADDEDLIAFSVELETPSH